MEIISIVLSICGTIIAIISLVLSYKSSKISECIQKDDIKSAGCPNVIFNDVQEFVANANDSKFCTFKARFHDKNNFLLKKAKITKIKIYKSQSKAYEDYDDSEEIYSNENGEYETLEYTPKSDNKIDKLIQEEDPKYEIQDFYYLKQHIKIEYNIKDLFDFEGYMKMEISMSVLTIYNLETNLNCNLIFEKGTLNDSLCDGKRQMCNKKICHRFTTFGEIEYIEKSK